MCYRRSPAGSATTASHSPQAPTDEDVGDGRAVRRRVRESRDYRAKRAGASRSETEAGDEERSVVVGVFEGVGEVGRERPVLFGKVMLAGPRDRERVASREREAVGADLRVSYVQPDL